MRLIFFLLMILIGLAAGLYYTWVVNPVQYIDTAPDSLREDYKADYVLMVAEVYRLERDSARASSRLSALGKLTPARYVAEAILIARNLEYSQGDLETMALLANALQSTTSGSGSRP
jgi:hypothetical protein